MKCPSCGVPMKPLFQSLFCPNDCDKPELRLARVSAEIQKARDRLAKPRIWVSLPPPPSVTAPNFLVTEHKMKWGPGRQAKMLYIDPKLGKGDKCPLCGETIEAIRPLNVPGQLGARMWCGGSVATAVPGAWNAAADHVWEAVTIP